MVCRTLLVTILLVQLPLAAGPQNKSPRHGLVSLPQGGVTRIPSPDGNWTLIFECPNDCASRKLWIEDEASHTRRLINDYERNLTISWAPDSKSFFVNDQYGSNGALCYVYDPLSLKVTDLASLLARGDPNVTEFLKAGHSYLEAKRWVNSRELLVILFGHFDSPRSRGFTMQYRVGLDGRVQKLWHHPDEEPQ